MSNQSNAIRPVGGRHGGVPNVKGQGAKAPMKTLKRLLSYAFSRYKVAMAFVVLFVLLSAGATAVGAAFFAPTVNELIITPEHPVIDMNIVYTNIIIMACVYVAGGLS